MLEMDYDKWKEFNEGFYKKPEQQEEKERQRIKIDELERLFKEGKLVEMIEEVVSKAKDLIKEERLKYSPK